MRNNKSLLLTMCFPLCGIAFVILSLTPMRTHSSLSTAPDLLFCYIIAFLFRFPQNATFISITMISLFADFLWFRPLGLTTLTTFLASEFIRFIIKARERVGLMEEFSYVSLILVITIVFQELVKFFTLIPSLGVNQIIQYILFTLLTYLVIILFIKVISRSRLV